MNKQPPSLTRRHFLWASLSGLVSYWLAACGLRPSENDSGAATAPQPAQLESTLAGASAPPATEPAAATQPAATAAAQVLQPTPACGDEDDPTPAQTEGPFYTPNSPERTSLLEAGIQGTYILLTGQVLSTGCEPIAQALVDFWHADDAGIYDNVGYKLRGHQFTDDQGRYSLETIVPGLYPGRTRHFHVKVQAAHQPILTTQLYFPGEAANEADLIFRPELLMQVQEAADGLAATFNFVLEVN